MEVPPRLLPKAPSRLADLGAPSGELPPLPWDAVTLDLEQAGATFDGDWRALAERMAPGARLVLRLPAAWCSHGAERSRVEVALAEAGFALRRGEGEWLVASATPYRVRAATESDYEQIATLFERCFFHRRSLEHWRWQYLRNPNLPSPGPQIALVSSPADELVAHYTGYPLRFDRFLRDGTRASFLAHQIGDTMTAPEARHIGRGPTSLLARSAYYFFARYSRRQVAFVYGFNVGNIQKFSLRYFNGSFIADVPYWRRTAERPHPVAGKAPLWRRRSRYRARLAEAPDERWSRLYEQVAESYGCLVRRSAEYLRWRYTERPGFEYTLVEAMRRESLVGWGVFRRDGPRLLLGDLLLHPRHGLALRELLSVALAAPVGAGTDEVVAWCSERPSFAAQALRGVGFERAPEPQGLGMICQPIEAPDAPEWLRRELYFTMGDGDLF